MDSAKTDARRRHLLGARGPRLALVQRHHRDPRLRAARADASSRPKDPRRDGLVQWLFLNKKLNHWKSTRATAEVLYSLAHYLKQEGALGVREEATVTVGGQTTSFVFEPDRYTGKKNQVVVPGREIGPGDDVDGGGGEDDARASLFASATWHFSTEQLPDGGARRPLRGLAPLLPARASRATSATLKPLAEGARSRRRRGRGAALAARQARRPSTSTCAIRAPPASSPRRCVSRLQVGPGPRLLRGGARQRRRTSSSSGCRPASTPSSTACGRTSRARSGSPPATVQSMYAPEFDAYSAGAKLRIAP